MDELERIQLNSSKEFDHLIIVPKENEVNPNLNLQSNLKFKNKLLTEAQQSVANCILNNRNVLFAAPPLSGKTFVAFWAVYRAIQRRQRFAFVVLNEFCQISLMNEFRRIDCNQFCVVTDLETIDPKLNLIITAKLLSELIKTNFKAVTSIDFFIFDNIDNLQDNDHGYHWEEVLIYLPKTSNFLITSSVFSNIDVFVGWLAIMSKLSCDLIRVNEWPFVFDFNIAIPTDFNNMKLICLSKQKREFDVDVEKREEESEEDKEIRKEARFENVMNQLFTPKNNSEVVDFVKACNSTFPIRRTIRELYKDKSWPIIVVTFDEYQSQWYAWETGTKMGLLGPAKKKSVTELMHDFKGSVNLESDEFLLLDKLKEIFLNGVAYVNASMPKKIREFVESLFRCELLKVLVVTEEVAINSFFRGKMVIISSCRKFDGTSYRYLTNYEFQSLLCLTHEQASIHHVPKITLILDWKISYETLKSIIKLNAPEFKSFIENSSDVQQLSLMGPSSFHRFLQRIEEKERRKEINDMKAKLEEMRSSPFENQIRDYLRLKASCEELDQRIDNLTFGNPKNIAPYLNCGRLVKIVNGDRDFGVAILINYTFKEPDDHKLYVALRISRDSHHNIHDFTLLTPAHPDEIQVPYSTNKLPIAPLEIVQVPIECVKCIYVQRLRLPEDLRDQKSLNFLKVLLNGFLNGYSLEKVLIGTKELNELRNQLKNMEQQRDSKVIAKREDFKEMLENYEEIDRLKQKIEENEEFIQKYREEPFIRG